MKYLSLFSGVGGFELGIQRAFNNERTHHGTEARPSEPDEDMRQVRQRQTVSEMSRSAGRKRATNKPGKLQLGDEPAPLCIGYSEIDKYAIATYERNFNGHTNYGDATLINERELPDFDLLVGGFPCQAFSVAGKRHGFNDTRGTLFFDIARILSHKRPRHFLLENVKGLLSHDSGKTLQTILGVLTDLGYVVEWQVLNAKDFGVPQNRERIFIVGHLGGECGRQVFPITGDNHKATFGTIHRSYHKGQHTGSYVAEKKKGGINVVGELDNETWQKRHEQIRRVHGTDGISPTLPTGTGGGVMTKIALPVLTPDRLEKRQNGRRFKTNGEPSFTLNTQDKHGIYDGARIRRLTPTECERLMSWPDGWTIGSDTQRYKQCGNGVVSNVVQAVIENMKGCLL